MTNKLSYVKDLGLYLKVQYHPKSPDSGCFIAHSYSATSKIPSSEPSKAQTNTVKYHFLGD